MYSGCVEIQCQNFTLTSVFPLGALWIWPRDTGRCCEGDVLMNMRSQTVDLFGLASKYNANVQLRLFLSKH